VFAFLAAQRPVRSASPFGWAHSVTLWPVANHAEFEEKEYETASNAELATGGAVWSSGQVIEQIVGYDTVAAPVARHVIWQLLRVPRPAGVRLLPKFWFAGHQPPTGRLPRAPVSLILQYKRPDYLHGPQAAQWSYWHQPYYRFNRTEAQHRVLRRLDRLLDRQAVVRYACPAFWRFSELEAAVLTREVLKLTGFVSPTALGVHKAWTYVTPGLDGKANPSADRLAFQTVSELVSDFQTSRTDLLPELLISGPEALRRHLAVVSAAARAQEPGLRRRVSEWVDRVARRDLLISAQGIQQLEDVVTISSLAYRIGASWQITDSFDPPLI
jgi:hypothetical protein